MIRGYLKGRSFEQVLAVIFLVAAAVGLLASFQLTYDKIQVLKNPAYVPGCNINPVLSCGSVMKTEQANLLGMPNTIFGLVAFGALAAIGLALLAGATFKRWFWIVINLAALGGFIFFIYLFFQGVYRIGAICPYCFLVWMVVPPVLWYTTLYNLKQGHIGRTVSEQLKRTLLRFHGDILGLWYLAVFLVLLTHFWYYWKTLI